LNIETSWKKAKDFPFSPEESRIIEEPFSGNYEKLISSLSKEEQKHLETLLCENNITGEYHRVWPFCEKTGKLSSLFLAFLVGF